MVKSLRTLLSIFVSLALLFIQSSLARDSRRGVGGSTYNGGDIFLKGTYMEIGLNPGGGFGSRKVSATTSAPFSGTAVPAGYHNRTSQLGIVVDWNKDGWKVGNPAQSGDFILEGGIKETGFHLSWTGNSATQYFNQMPLKDDDINIVFPRGCTSCKNGKIPGCVPTKPGQCNCPKLMPQNYSCPFPRWDYVTIAFTDLSAGDYKYAKYVGKAM